MRVFLDTNVFADMFLVREEKHFNDDADKILGIALENDSYQFCVSPISIATSFYLGRKMPSAVECIKTILKSVVPLQVDERDVRFALSSKMKDKEDAMQLSCAKGCGCDVIITRDEQHFEESTIPVLTPEQFLRYALK